MVNIICAVIAGIASVITAVVGIRVERANKQAERHAELRRKESLLSLEMMDATLQLSIVTSNALTGGHNNGNVERAREAAKTVGAKYADFMREVTAGEISL